MELVHRLVNSRHDKCFDILMPKILPPIVLTETNRIELQRLARSRTGAANIALRARMILLCAASQSNREIATRFGVKPHTVGMWRKRFEEDGYLGLHDEKRSGRPPIITPALKQKIVYTVCRKPPKGLGRWSVRSLSARLGISRDTVHRTLVAHDLQPHRLRTFNFSPDPRFEESYWKSLASTCHRQIMRWYSASTRKPVFRHLIEPNRCCLLRQANLVHGAMSTFAMEHGCF